MNVFGGGGMSRNIEIINECVWRRRRRTVYKRVGEIRWK